MDFPHTINIIGTNESQDGRKGNTEHYEVLAVNVNCFVQPSTAEEELRDMQRGFRVTHKIYFKAPPDVGPLKNYFYWVDEDGSPHCFEYQAHRDGTAGLGIMYKVQVEELSIWPRDIPNGTS